VPLDAKTDYGIVKWVTDGDTIVVDIRGDLHTVRYLGIDAPSDSVKVEFMGQTAAQRNSDLVLNRVVRLVSGVSDKDQFGQLLRYVFAVDMFVNYELVREGLARANNDQLDGECAETFALAEQAAKQETLGLWAPIAMLVPTTQPPILGTLIPSAVTPAFLPAGTATFSPIPQTSPQPSATPRIVTLPPLPTFTSSRPGSSSTPTLTPSPTPTLTRSSVVSPTEIPYVDIVWIEFEGGEPGQADEYVELQNFDSIPVNMEGWLLQSEETEESFVFPSIVLQPDESCKVYTNKILPDSCGGSFQSSQEVWNDTSDCAYLYTPEGFDATFYCY
jgi:endonuclease YncB( thermonuclease family)